MENMIDVDAVRSHYSTLVTELNEEEVIQKFLPAIGNGTVSEDSNDQRVKKKQRKN
jgi:hypothetical protein